MLKIKLTRRGKRNAPTYRIAVQEARTKVSGRAVAEIGYLIPRVDGNHEFKVDKKAYEGWVAKGAVPTESVVKLINKKYTYTKYEPKKAKAEQPEAESLKVGNDKNSNE
ncbi:MAG: 30S ribosomal protein S16 [Patescibacteria group bacterium]